MLHTSLIVKGLSLFLTLLPHTLPGQSNPAAPRSIQTTARGNGTLIVAGSDKHQIKSVMVILKDGGDLELTLYMELQLNVTGKWSAGKTATDPIDLRITGGAVDNNANGSGKLILRADGKSIDRLMFKATGADGTTYEASFVADNDAGG